MAELSQYRPAARHGVIARGALVQEPPGAGRGLAPAFQLRRFRVRQPWKRQSPECIDSTGLKLFGQGEWDEEKHGQALP